jgi:hypothetical protein
LAPARRTAEEKAPTETAPITNRAADVDDLLDHVAAEIEAGRSCLAV